MTRRGAALFALTVLALGAVFLSRRASDVGRLPASLAALGADLARQPLLDAGTLAATAGGILVAALIVLSWYGLGDLLIRALARLGRTAPGGETPLSLAQRCVFGAGAWSFVWFFLGVAGLALATTAARRRAPRRGDPAAAGRGTLGLAA